MFFKKFKIRFFVFKANNNAQNGVTVPVPITPYLEGYYFGNQGKFFLKQIFFNLFNILIGWYAKCGAFFDKFCYFFFGPIDFQQDPYTRNKVDYVCRVIFVSLFLFYVFLYVMITVLYWAGNYN